MAKLKVNVEVIDEELCKNCERLKVVEVVSKNCYDQEVRSLQCANRKSCERLMEFIRKEKFLGID